MIVRESISFKRGLDPKKALDVGIYRKEGQVIKRFLKPLEFRDETFDWINQCPPLMKLLGVEKESDLDYIIGFDTEWVIENNEDIDDHDISADFSRTHPEEIYTPFDDDDDSWKIIQGKTPDGSKVIKYDVGMNDGFLARIDWLR